VSGKQVPDVEHDDAYDEGIYTVDLEFIHATALRKKDTFVIAGQPAGD